MFQSTPAITGERAHAWADLLAVSGVSIHARHYWRASRPGCATLLRVLSFQSTPAITGERAVKPIFTAARVKVSIHARHYWRASPAWPPFSPDPRIGFNPRPPLLASEPRCRERLKTGAEVSIHARHYWRASQARHRSNRGQRGFQSTPAITGERASRPSSAGHHLRSFNPRPPLLASEPDWYAPTRCIPSSFNPRPPLLASEPVAATAVMAAATFQSTPAITGERAIRLNCRRCMTLCFNPRPPLLASEPTPACSTCAP